MSTALTLLSGVRWNGRPIAGQRPQALLAALVSAGGQAVTNYRLVSAVWVEQRPADPVKALQVLVSRVRAATCPDLVVRDLNGYRLGVPVEHVDALALKAAVAHATRLLADDAHAAREACALALDLAEGVTKPGPEEAGPLATVRREGAANADTARVLRARADCRLGCHADALTVLEATQAERPDDDSLLADLLRSEAAVRGVPAALGRYEKHRAGLRERLGADPGEELQRVHRDLLALDRPVREGVQYDGTTLLGRDDDVQRLLSLIAGHRVVSIVGPGGLGKTRLAHVIGRTTQQPVVHFVELLSVGSAQELVGEVGSALGVRDSVSGRRVLTTVQRADVRARIGQQLGRAPTLLILDNCEHLVDAVADLVAFLVATTSDLRVLTTTRAPLAIAAERVYQLGELASTDAVELFCQRAAAARPGVRLPREEVATVVERLDGLPLAIELAAAKVRVMSVADIGRRLSDRFALLRGGDRSAPDRHQTLLAVIDWSWNLLAEPEQRALRWLSVFHEAFTLSAADSVLGEDALDAVQRLADQSLIGVVEGSRGVHYRMLETVREFGQMQLVGAGEEADAEQAHWDWAVAFATAHGPDIFSGRQFDAVDAICDEESNLADVLRRALAQPDPGTVVQVLATLGPYWSVRGEHARLLVLAGAITCALSGWVPPPELAGVTRTSLVATLSNAMMVIGDAADPLQQLLHQLGPGEDPQLAALISVVAAYDATDGESSVARLEQLAESSDRHLAIAALQWRSHAQENAGEVAGAIRSAERALALTRPDDGAWTAASLHTQLGQLDMQLGRVTSAERHALAALPVLERLGASDDIIQMRSLLMLAALDAGDLRRAEGELSRVESLDAGETTFGGRLMLRLGRAELALARGEQAALDTYRRGVEEIRELRIPGLPSTGLEPWLLFAESAALSAHAHFGGDTDVPYATELSATLRARVARTLDASSTFLDYPVSGVALFALGSWGLCRRTTSAEVAVRLLVIADRFAYNRTVPTMAWGRIATVAEERTPGMLAALATEYGDRRGPELLAEARVLVEKLGGGHSLRL